MKKFYLIASFILATTVAANAQFEGIGWDGENGELVGRIGIGGYNHVEAGTSFFYNNNANGDPKYNFTASGRFLLALHSWEKLTGYLNAGAYFRDDNTTYLGSVPGTPPGRLYTGSLTAKVGYMPEVVLLPHLAVSMLFGASIQLVPDFVFNTIGNRISIVDGFNFRILF
jgi:hypothetical protein